MLKQANIWILIQFSWLYQIQNDKPKIKIKNKNLTNNLAFTANSISDGHSYFYKKTCYFPKS